MLCCFSTQSLLVFQEACSLKLGISFDSLVLAIANSNSPSRRTVQVLYYIFLVRHDHYFPEIKTGRANRNVQLVRTTTTYSPLSSRMK